VPSIRSTQGEVIEFGQRLRVGRAEGNDLRIDLDTVSSDHGVLEVRGGGLYVRDLGSTNGTRVKGRRILGWTRLEEGDVVRFGPDSEWAVIASDTEGDDDCATPRVIAAQSGLAYPAGEDRFVIGSSSSADLRIEGRAEVAAVIVLEDGERRLIPMEEDAEPRVLGDGDAFEIGGVALRFVDHSGRHIDSTVPERTRSKSYDLSLRLVHERPGEGRIELGAGEDRVVFDGVPNRFVLLLVLARVVTGREEGIADGWVEDERLRVALWGRAGAASRYHSALGKVIYDTRRMIAAKGIDPFFIEKSKGRTRLRLDPSQIAIEGE